MGTVVRLGYEEHCFVVVELVVAVVVVCGHAAGARVTWVPVGWGVVGNQRDIAAVAVVDKPDDETNVVVEDHDMRHVPESVDEAEVLEDVEWQLGVRKKAVGTVVRLAAAQVAVLRSVLMVVDEMTARTNQDSVQYSGAAPYQSHYYWQEGQPLESQVMTPAAQSPDQLAFHQRCLFHHCFVGKLLR